ncbi:MAG: hypothetical protein ACOC1O_00965 [bacterium]
MPSKEEPKAPEIDMSKIKNAEALEKKGDNTFSKMSPKKSKGRGKGKFNFDQPEKIMLPSGGRLYKNVTDDEDILNGFIYMYPMRVKEEEILSTSRFLKSGAATRMVIENCIASDIEAKDILLFDSNYLLFYLRSISYGDEYKFKLKCKNSACEQEFDHTVKISELKFEELPEEIEEPIVVELPRSGYTVKTILPRLFHSEEIYQRNLKKKKSTADADTRMVDNLLATIIEITDPDGEKVPQGDWHEFLEAIPGMDRAALKEKTDFSSGVDEIKGIECPYCGTEYSGSIPVGADFFRF